MMDFPWLPSEYPEPLEGCESCHGTGSREVWTSSGYRYEGGECDCITENPLYPEVERRAGVRRQLDRLSPGMAEIILRIDDGSFVACEDNCTHGVCNAIRMAEVIRILWQSNLEEARSNES